MMKTIKYIFSLCLVVATIWSCADDEKNVNLSAVEAPTALAMAFDVTQDNTGLVTITPTAEGAITFDISLGDDTEELVELENGSNTEHTYAEGTYTVTATAYGITGLSTTLSQELVVSFNAPENLEVTVENSTSVSKLVNVTVDADFAVSFDVYSGETGSTDPISANIGETAAIQYSDAGVYDITIEVKGAAIQTTTYVVEDFEVTEILAPTTAAPTPPARQPGDVVSIYSDAYTNITLSELNPNWGGQSTVLTEVQFEGNNTWFYSDLSYTGIVTDYGNPTDLSAKEFVHFDYWTPDATQLGLKIANTSYADGDPLKEDIEIVDDIVLGEWRSVEIPLEDYTTDLSGVTQLLFDSMGSGTPIVYIDNLYFYKQPSNSTAQVITFEGGLEFSSFEGGDISLVVNPDTNGNNSSSVARMIKGAGANYAGSKITIASPFDFSSSSTVTLKIWSPRVGLNLLMKFEDDVPWPNTAGSAEITATTTVANQWQTLTFDHSGISENIDWYNMVLIMDNGTSGDGSSNYTIYLDDISTTPVLDFEPEYSDLTSFEGGVLSVVDNPDTNGNTSSSVAKMIKGSGANYAGSKITIPAPFNINSATVTLKIWSPRVGLNLLMKFEDDVPWPNTAGSAEITATTTVANQWQTLTFDHSGISESIDWYNMILIMDNGTVGDGSENYTIYLDDITIN